MTSAFSIQADGLITSDLVYCVSRGIWCSTSAFSIQADGLITSDLSWSTAFPAAFGVTLIPQVQSWF